MPNFELYQRGDHAHRVRTDPTVTIQRRGYLSLSRAAMAMLGNPEAVTLLVEQDERLIGFRRSSLTTKKARKVSSPCKGMYLVSAVSLCKFLGVDLTEARRYPLQVIEGTPCIDLKEPGTVVTSNRRGTGNQS